MNNKFKKVVSLVLAGSMMTLMACKDDKVSTSNSGSSNEKVGNVNIVMPMSVGEENALGAVISAYNEINPLVNVIITKQSADTYKDTLSQALSTTNLNEVTFDIVRNNEVSHLFGANKFVDFSQYLYEENEYADNGELWADTMSPLAYNPTGAKGEIYNINFESTMLRLFYNKTMLTEYDIDPEGIKTWNDLVDACEVLYEADKIPFAVGGNQESFFQLQMSWMIRTYVDQYFRDVTEEVHVTDDDWNYDFMVDGDWEYKPYPTDIENATAEDWNECYFNDTHTEYTANELKVLKGVMDGTYGHNTDKYKSMLSNFMEIFPKYGLEGFSTAALGNATMEFFNKNAGFTIMTTSFFEDYQVRKEVEEEYFELGHMDLPPMTRHANYDVDPDVNYTRSIGGPHGFYGIVNKSSKNVDLAIDFMKFWTSRQGQQAYIDYKEQAGTLMMGIPFVNGVVVPDEIYALKGTELKGIADDNPANIFARGLENEGYTTRDFKLNAELLFSGKLGGYNKKAIETYANNVDTSFKTYMEYYLAEKGYSANCLDDVKKYPFD